MVLLWLAVLAHAVSSELTIESWPVVEACKLEVDWTDRRAVRLHHSDGGTMTSLFGATTAAETPTTPQLCATPGRKDLAVLTMATDVRYLRKWAEFFWNKLCYCRRHRLPFVLFLGNVTAAMEAPSAWCGPKKASSHWSKAVAIHAALDAGYDEVLVMDADAIFTAASFHRPGLLECYGRMAGNDVDVFAGVEHYQVFLNAAVLYVRNRPWTRALLGTWWRDRCGDKDQLILWHALFRLWSSPHFNYDDRLLDYVSRNYSKDHHRNYRHNMTYRNARRTVVFDMAQRMFPRNFYPSSRSPSGRIMLRENSLLRFPHLALFPLTAMRKNTTLCQGGDDDMLPPFRGFLHQGHPPSQDPKQRGHGSSFIAHTKHRPTFDCCPKQQPEAPRRRQVCVSSAELYSADL